MSFEWRELLDLARILPSLTLPNISSEAIQRASISRAYYAAFGHARTRAQSEGFLGLESAEDHVRLRDHFSRTGRADVARVLNKLRQWRNQADYQNEPGNLAMMLKESLAEAQRIINRLG